MLEIIKLLIKSLITKKKVVNKIEDMIKKYKNI